MGLPEQGACLAVAAVQPPDAVPQPLTHGGQVNLGPAPSNEGIRNWNEEEITSVNLRHNEPFETVPYVRDVRKPYLRCIQVPQSTYSKYVEYRAVSGVFQNIEPPLTAQLVCTPPPLVRGENTLAGWRGGGWSIFWMTPDIGLASYSIIPLR
jgi:hypothetical protein